ncbi:MAG: rhodanese-like domain-containing protein, partial [Flavobacteriaceae bacterium]
MNGYAGDIDPAAAWEMLAANPGAVLVDVRSRAEWSFVGLPDLGALGRQPLLAEWAAFPQMAPDPGFAAALDARLKAEGVDPAAPLLFLCRSGARSRNAAAAMTAAGYAGCFNVAEGFEGDVDAEG